MATNSHLEVDRKKTGETVFSRGRGRRWQRGGLRGVPSSGSARNAGAPIETVAVVHLADAVGRGTTPCGSPTSSARRPRRRSSVPSG